MLSKVKFSIVEFSRVQVDPVLEHSLHFLLLSIRSKDSFFLQPSFHVSTGPSALGCTELEYTCDSARKCDVIDGNEFCMTRCTTCMWCLRTKWTFKRMCRSRYVFCCLNGKCHFFGFCSDLNVKITNQTQTANK